MGVLEILGRIRAGWCALLFTVACGGAARDPRVPEALAQDARPFGLTMLGNGFSWHPSDPRADPARARFAWVGRTASGDRELLYRFAIPKVDDPRSPLVTTTITTLAAGLASGPLKAPTEQAQDFVALLGVDRVVSVSFDVSTAGSTEFHHGIAHGIVQHGALTVVVVLSNDVAAAVVPLPRSVGARGR